MSKHASDDNDAMLTIHEDVYTVAGTGDAAIPMRDNDNGAAVTFNHPMGIAIDLMGNMYVTNIDTYHQLAHYQVYSCN